MKFSVCIKQVPDITAPIQVKGDELIQDTDRMVLDAYSASAVEGSLVLAEKYEGEVEVVSIGPEKVKETIRKALAMGVSKGTHIVTGENTQYDSAVYAAILSAWFKNNADYEVILLGKQSQDTDAGLTGSMLAEHLDLPYVTNAIALNYNPDKQTMEVKRQGDSSQEMIELPVPCLITCSNDMNEPRIPSLKGIMQSKKKPVDSINLTELNLSEESLKKEQKNFVTGYESLPEREPGKKLEGEPGDIVTQLVDLLEHESGVL